MTDTTSNLGTALAYEDYLPVSWSLPDREPDSILFSGLNDNNVEVLQNILTLEKHYSDHLDEDADRDAGDLALIDFKLNLLLDMIVQVYSKELDIPPESSISLRSYQLQWHSTQRQNQDDYLLVDLYLSKRIPRPITLYGRVSGVDVLEQNSYRINLDLEQLSPAFLDLLERFIFLKHRRMVASARREHIE